MSIQLTVNAIEKVKSLRTKEDVDQGKAFRVSLEPGGCSGFEYDFSMEKPKATDVVIQQADITVAVDQGSVERLRNTTIDCVESLSGWKFSVVNPNEKGACGCGVSVMFDEPAKK